MFIIMFFSSEKVKRSTKLVRILDPKIEEEFEVGPALFGPNLGTDIAGLSGELYVLPGVEGSGNMGDGCQMFSEENAGQSHDKIVMMARGGCLFVNKVRRLCWWWRCTV